MSIPVARRVLAHLLKRLGIESDHPVVCGVDDKDAPIGNGHPLWRVELALARAFRL